MKFDRFDQRGYPTTDVASGYAEWAATYEDVVRDEMDIRLLERLRRVIAEGRAVDLACGTGRIGVWLHSRGVRHIDGIDMTEAMLERARSRRVYETLREGDLRSTPFEADAYDLATASLVDEHLPEVAPMYTEAARLLKSGGVFLLVSYHPQFLMSVGMPTHYHRPDGEAVAIETHVHLLSDHVAAGTKCGLSILEVHEGLIDDDYIQAKPKWERFRGAPISFVMAWRR